MSIDRRENYISTSSFLVLPRWVSTVYCHTFEQCQSCCVRIAQAIALHRNNELCVCGFDLEWRVMFRAGKQRPVALMQLFFGMEVFLFHLFAFRERGLPWELVGLLVNPKLIKTGLNINNDIAKMERDYPSLTGKIRGVCDLRTVSKACELSICNAGASIVEGVGNSAEKGTGSGAVNISWPTSSLENMVEKMSKLVSMTVDSLKSTSSYRTLGTQSALPMVQLPKPDLVRCGNWEVWPLTHDFQSYAALDAFASFLVFHCLNKLYVQCHLQALTLTPPLPTVATERKEFIATHLIGFHRIVQGVLACSKYGHPPLTPIIATVTESETIESATETEVLRITTTSSTQQQRTDGDVVRESKRKKVGAANPPSPAPPVLVSSCTTIAMATTSTATCTDSSATSIDMHVHEDTAAGLNSSDSIIRRGIALSYMIQVTIPPSPSQ